MAGNFRITGYPAIYLFEEGGSKRYLQLDDVLTVSGFNKSLKKAKKDFKGGGRVPRKADF